MGCRKSEICRRIRHAFTGTVSLLLLSFPVACKKETPPAPPPPKVTFMQPVRQSVTDYLELTGNTQAVNTVQLVARVAGYLDKALFKDGQLVEKGQLLFLIQQNTYRENVRQAEAELLRQKAVLEFAENQFLRYSTLVRQNSAARADLDNWRYQRDSALANLESAQARYELAKLNLSYTEVRAPFDGRIDRRLRDPGNLVGSGESTVLAAVNQISPIYVYFTIGDNDLARLMKNAQGIPGRGNARRWPLLVGLVNEEGYPHRGYVDFAAGSMNATTGTLLMRGVLANKEGKILPGFYARVRLPIETKEAFLVPEAAVANDQQGAYLLIVNGNNRVERRGIRAGARVNNLRAVEEGLTGNERVIVKGLLKAAPGRQVNPVPEGPAPPPSPRSGERKP